MKAVPLLTVIFLCVVVVAVAQFALAATGQDGVADRAREQAPVLEQAAEDALDAIRDCIEGNYEGGE